MRALQRLGGQQVVQLLALRRLGAFFFEGGGLLSFLDHGRAPFTAPLSLRGSQEEG
jgi:hypothetical protein